jgi:hypothetical protein
MSTIGVRMYADYCPLGKVIADAVKMHASSVMPGFIRFTAEIARRGVRLEVELAKSVFRPFLRDSIQKLWNPVVYLFLSCRYSAWPQRLCALTCFVSTLLPHGNSKAASG